MNAHDIVLRRPDEPDAEPLARVSIETWNVTYGPLVPPSVLETQTYEERRRVWEGLIARPGNLRHLIAEDPAHGPVGFVTWGRPRGPKLRDFDFEIFALYLLPRYQGRGIGHQLLRGAFEAIEESEGRSVCLWVLEKNKQARAFYEAHGAVAAAAGSGMIGGAYLGGVVYIWEDIGEVLHPPDAA